MNDEIKDQKDRRLEILEKARIAKAEKKAKELAAKEATDAKSENATKKVSRRKSMQLDGPLAFREDLKDPNFEYRWALDEGWRIPTLIDYGYEFVRDPECKLYQPTMVMTHSQFGSIIARPDASGKSNILMRIPKDEYELIKTEKREDNSQKLRAKTEENGLYEKQFDHGKE